MGLKVLIHRDCLFFCCVDVGTHSDDRTGLPSVRVIVCSNMLVVTMYNIFIFYMLYILLNVCVYYIYKASLSPGSVEQIMPYI
jgi:hypothetical protein